ncbi:MAG: fibronectin type III domain-containing protein, partial [Planctomycetaceae bacterium]|nr:fibronectin type III domain-containing protein [Planctomycetaceae bacterium]
DALAIGYSGVATYNAGSNNAGSAASATYYAVRDGNSSRIYGADSGGNASSSTAAPPAHRFGYMGDVDPTITSPTVGLQFLNEDKGSSLFAVSRDGQFFRLARPGHGGATRPGTINVFDVVDFNTTEILNGRQLGGLATGPVNLEGGRFNGTFFAVTTDGELFCIDPTGGAGGEAVIVDNVFDSNGDGIADSWISNPTGNNVRGLAFSPLDVNLWHTTTDRSDNITSSITHDLTRVGTVTGGQSMHFGLEEWVAGNTPYVEYRDVDGGGAGQFGVRSSGVWQRHLSAGLGISESTYNLPGGAHGRMQTDAFSLAGYNTTDKPTLYFSYWLETQDAQASTNPGNQMRDSARVLGSIDGGQTWELLATNNQQRSSLDGAGPMAELPPRLTPSANAANAGSDASENQQVQELFDTAEWRQARVDLGQFAGESSVLLRFDFSTGGDLDRGGQINNAKIVADATRSVVSVTALGNLQNDVTVVLDSVQGLVEVVGNIASPNAEIVFDETASSTGTATVVSIDAATNAVVLRPVDVAVELENVYGVGDLVDFYSAGESRDNINGNASTLGDFGSPTARSEDNNYRGFNIDAIMVGFAERGEAVVNASAEPNAQFFTFNEDRSLFDYPEQVLQGEYQLEIRRGTEFGTQDDETIGRFDSIFPGEPSSFVTINTTFDTNDRMVRETAVISRELEVNSLDVVDGVVVTEAGHAVVPLGPLGGGLGTLLQGDDATVTTQHSVLKWAVDLANQPAAVLEVAYSVNEEEQLTQLPDAFTIADETDLPTGDGVALSVDGGINWTRIANFSTTTTFSGFGTYETTLEIDLLDAGLVLSDTTVIGVFRSDANEGGITVRNAVIRTAPVIATSGLVGDKNNEFENQQGQFIVQNTIVTDASTYGIRIDAGRVGDGSQSPDLGVAQNRAVLNNAGLVPGAVVTNTVVANSGVAGIYFGGTPDTANDTDSVRPYGRLVNNTIYGGGSGIGIDVANNAAPTILNNVFSELDTGVKVDSSSRLDGVGDASTVIGTSAFYLVGTEVAGTTQSLGLTLTEDPFVDKARNNFYPAANSRIIDSSMNSLEDRPGFTVVKDSINIPDSPILAPQKDLYGLTRDDDPDVASIPGLGLNAFKDRGAIERLDITQPEASLAVPLDQSKIAPIDLNNTLHAVELEGDAARQQEKFVLQLSDIGTGIDQISVTQNENTSVTVIGVYARVSGNFVNLNTLTLDTVDYSGLLANASVSINNVDAGVTVTSIAGTTLTLSGPVTAVDNSVISFGFGDTTTVSTNRVVVSDADSVNAGILINGINGVAGANAIAVVDSTMNTIELDQAASVVSNAEVTLTAFLLQRDGQVLEAGNDYFFQYNTNTNQVVFAAASTFGLGDYELQVAPTVQDLAGNSLLVNDSINGTTEFSIVLLDVPSAPSAPLGTSGDEQVTLTWGVPSTSASAPITDYIIETSDNDGLTWFVFNDETSASTTAIVTTHNGVTLVNGTPYRFRVRGVTRVGEGENSPQSAAITPLRLPTAPLNLAVVTGNAQLDFSWTAPTDDGEDLAGTDSIVDYLVEYSSDAGATWTAHTSNPTSSPVTVTGLTGGVGYLLRVAARNARGQGDYATTTVAETPQGVPGLVQNLLLVAGVGEVTLDWDAGTDGALGIDEYVVKFSINSSAFVDNNWNSNVAGPVTESGLSTGDSVVAQVFAKNGNGDGPVATSNTVVVAGTPGVVTGLVFTEEDGAIALSWTAPADTGGYPVEDYIIESTSDGGATWVAESDISNATTATISSHNGVPLVNGNEYSFRVSTKTSIATGSSTEITGGPAVPHTLPSAPVLNTPTSDDGSIGMTWSAPDNGGKPITDYVVQYKRASRTEWSTFTDGTSTAASATITGVNNGVSYVVRVAAVNQKGQGPWSAESSDVVPGNVPVQVTDLAATAQDGAVGLTWTVPTSTLTVTSHQIQYKKQSDSTWTTFSGTIAIEESVATATVTGLDNGVVYSFEVVAVNAVGSSPAATVSAEPFELPGVVQNLTASNAGNRVNLTWSAPTSDGGSDITDYAVQYRLASSSTWLTYNDGVSTGLSANVAGLSVGQSYEFQVAAITRFGTGAYAQSGTVTVGSVAPAPARVSAWRDGNNIQVLWDLVTMPAGVTFQYYQIQYREVGTSAWSNIATDTFNSELLSGSNFTRGKTYQFQVAAVANTGTGAYKISNNVTY